MKICLVSCHAGHLTELLMLLPAFEGHDRLFVTQRNVRVETLSSHGRVFTLPAIGFNPWRMLFAFFQAARILHRERPHLIVSTGTQIAIPFFVLSRLLGCKSIFVESWCRIHSASRTGRIIYPLADYFFVQWPTMLEIYGAKARYEGGLYDLCDRRLNQRVPV